MNKHKIVQVPGSSTHAVVNEEGATLGHFASEEEARQYARDASQPVEGTTPAIPTGGIIPPYMIPKAKKKKHAKAVEHAPKKKHKQSK